MNAWDSSAADYFVLSAHREENIDAPEQFRRLTELPNLLVSSYGEPVVFSIHPRTRKRIEAEGTAFPESVRLLKPLAFSDYVHLMMGARATLSDSGTITEESSILNFRALNIREAHERPEGMEEGAAMMTGLDAERILECLRVLESQTTGAQRTLGIVADYDVPNVSEKVTRILHSYVSYINRNVWHKTGKG